MLSIVELARIGFWVAVVASLPNRCGRQGKELALKQGLRVSTWNATQSGLVLENMEERDFAFSQSAGKQLLRWDDGGMREVEV